MIVRADAPRRAPFTLDELRAIAGGRGGRLVSERVESSSAKLEWACAAGHRWQARAWNVAEAGTWCPRCIGRGPAAEKLAELAAIAAARGGRLISETYPGTHGKAEWECANGHRWYATPTGVKHSGTWCPRCAGRGSATDKLADLRALAAARGGRLVSKRFTGEHVALEWECADGHRWRARPSHVRHYADFCARCARHEGDPERLAELALIANKRGGRLVSERYVNASQKLEWECGEGHRWLAAASTIKRSQSWCQECGRGRKTAEHRLAELRAIALERGGRLLSREYISATDKLEWRCAEGHEWWAAPSNVRARTWCPRCAGRTALTLADLQQIAEARGGACVSARPRGARDKHRWRCAEGHVFSAAPSNVKSGRWCPRCARVSRWTLEDMEDIARSRGGACVSKRFGKLEDRLRWRCAEGHEWTSRAVGVVHDGTWCPACSGRQRGTIGKMRELARARGGACLSTTYVNAKRKLRWRCDKGHEWEASPNAIQSGRWCRYCHPFGAQGLEGFLLDRARTLARDRRGECLSDRWDGSQRKLRWRCQFGHAWEATPAQVGDGSWCPECAHRRRLSLALFQQIARERGGRCHSNRYVNGTTPLYFECEAGHRWNTRPLTVRQGSWCPECAREKKGEREDISLADMKEIAAAHGGACLSKEYLGNTIALLWRCRHGHAWEQAPRMIRRGSWCPICTGRVRPTLEDMRKAAAARGGRCLSKSYRGIDVKLKWACAKEHRWWATAGHVRGGGWCPRCLERRPDRGVARMHALAARHGGACLSARHVDPNKPLHWRCARGHEWRAREAVVARGRWCPKCA